MRRFVITCIVIVASSLCLDEGSRLFARQDEVNKDLLNELMHERIWKFNVYNDGTYMSIDCMTGGHYTCLMPVKGR